jgi:hypothetical protein
MNSKTARQEVDTADKPQKLSTSEVVFTEPEDKTVLAPGSYVKLTPSQPFTPLRGLSSFTVR